MNLQTRVVLIDQILELYKVDLAIDFDAYKNHCYRVYHFTLLLTKKEIDLEKLAIAIAFHDLAIWTQRTFDYLLPSQKLVSEYLESKNIKAWDDEIKRMISEHHKIFPIENADFWSAELLRKADWIDVSLGLINFGLKRSLVKEIKKAFPNLGFHKRLIQLTWKEFRSHPLKPLPMLKL